MKKSLLYSVVKVEGKMQYFGQSKNMRVQRKIYMRAKMKKRGEEADNDEYGAKLRHH